MRLTGCALQHNGWPCGTCFESTFKDGPDSLWQTVLLLRGDYKNGEYFYQEEAEYNSNLKWLDEYLRRS
jgi:hypothetical protein